MSTARHSGGFVGYFRTLFKSVGHGFKESNETTSTANTKKVVGFHEEGEGFYKPIKSGPDLDLKTIYKEDQLTGSKKIRHLTVSTMTHPNKKPITKEQKKRLKPNDCYLIWTTTCVGKFGAYYEAAEGSTLKPITIKIYRPQIFGHNTAHLEKKILSEVVIPPTIPKLIRTFQYDFQNVLILERLNGYSLHTKLGKYLRMNQQNTVVYFCEMITAVAFLHSKNIVHRNLALHSFWIQNDGHLKLIDYSKCIVGDIQLSWRSRKVTNYTAPELLKSGIHSKMVDIWALGVILYRMVSGFMPFQAESRSALIAAIQKNKEVYSTVFPRKLAFLCAKMLTKVPANRLGYGEPTIQAFMAEPAFKHISWLNLFNLPLEPAELFIARPDSDSSNDGQTGNKTPSVVQLNLMARNEINFTRRKTPLRYKEITTNRGDALFNEETLLNPDTRKKKKHHLQAPSPLNNSSNHHRHQGNYNYPSKLNQDGSSESANTMPPIDNTIGAPVDAGYRRRSTV